MWIFKKRPAVVDLTEHCNRNQERIRNIESQMKAVDPSFRGSASERKTIAIIDTTQTSQTASQTASQTSDGGYAAPFPFFMDNSPSLSPSSSSTQSAFTSSSNSGSGFGMSTYGSGEDAEEKRKRLANRLVQMTTQIEDLSNQIYQIQQRLEMIERKLGVGI